MRKLSLGLSVATMVMFADCSSGSGTNANSESPINSSNSSSKLDDGYDGEVEEFGDLPECSEKKDGKVYYVKDDGVAYTCRYNEGGKTGEWVEKKKKAEDGKSSSSREEKPGGSTPSSFGDGSIYDAAANTLTDLRDGQVYRTTTIEVNDAEHGINYSEVWMAENLNYRYLGPTDDLDSSSFCYDRDPANCTRYGRLYLWSDAMDSAGIIKGNIANGCGCYSAECSPGETVRGVCPKGWHLPSKSEWDELITAVGGSSTAGAKLKNSTGWNGSGNGTDNFGFSALPAGLRSSHGGYHDEGDYANFWSSTEYNSINAYSMYLHNISDYAGLENDIKDWGFSVRCLKD
ncbi:MAG: fibrobacter succinogenes major paralogous domain-containing protein [Fibrobacter sp.]|nr:fibrobacter succinogenes major paralogous domain-containing protein [Fibrobacter sp.]